MTEPRSTTRSGPSTYRGIGPTPRLWLWLAAIPVLIGVMLQNVGQIVFISRLDRILDPITMASRSIVLWNPYADMGSIQYQSVGYWIPFDAVFSLGVVTHTPTWITERLLVAALMIVAMWGCVRLADALTLGTRPFRVLGGLGYALSAVIISRVAQQQIFAMGAVFLPWSLVPLVRGAARGSTRTAAARSALAIALMGGANAAVTLAMIPIPLLYLLTRARGPRRASLLRWWIASVPMAVLWWIIGLRFFGAYGPNIIQYTETVGTTTGPTPVFEVIRGTADWFARLSINGVALPSGNSLAFRAIPIIGTTLLAAMGLAGLSSRRLPDRRFLVIVFLLGVAVVGGGFGGLFGNPLTDQYRTLLGGVLAPFRNIYKFQAWVTLPLILGSVHALSRVASLSILTRSNLRRALLPTFAALVVVASAFPIWTNLLTRGNGFTGEPQAWVDARSYLDAERTGRVLVVPGLSQQQFDWGYTQQLPLQWDADITWATRAQAPLGGPGNIAYLDAIERALSSGGDPGLVSFLQRGGFSQVVVAADSDFRAYGGADPQTMATALTASGLTIEASFGETGYGFGELHQIEIFGVPDARIAQTYATSALTWLSGDIESVLRMPTKLFGDRPYLLTSGKVPSALNPSQWIVTDGNQRVATNFGRNRNNRSYVLGPFETQVNGVALKGLQLRPSPVESQTVQTLTGIHRISASSVGPGVVDKAMPDSQPANVLDGNPFTSWRPNRLTIEKGDDWGTADQWIDIEFDAPRVVDPLAITLLLGVYGNPVPIEVSTETDNGRVTSSLEPINTAQPLAVAPGVTSRLRVTISGDSYHRFNDLIGISELTLPGEPILRSLRVPNDLDGQFEGADANTPAWVFTRELRTDATHGASNIRDFAVPHSASVDAVATGSVNDPADVLRILNGITWMSVDADSTLFDAPTLAPRNLIDNDPSTVWISANPIDDPNRRPVVTVSWLEPRVVSKLRLDLDPQFATPTSVTVTVNGEVFERTPAADGSFEVPDTLTVAVQFDLHYEPPVPAEPTLRAGLSGIEVAAIADLYEPPINRNASFTLDCGRGPSVVIDSTKLDYSATTTYGDLMDHRPATLEPCAQPTFDLVEGEHRVTMNPSPRGLTIDQFVLGNEPTLSNTIETSRTISLGRWGNTIRRATIGAGDENLFVVNEVFNRGWEARLDGVRLDALEIDGWRQAFVIPAGAGGELELTFTPNRPYQAGTAAGFGLLVLLVALALVPRRRPDALAPVGPGRWPMALTGASGVLLAIWTTGIGAPLLPVLWLLRRRLTDLLPVIALSAFTIAGTLLLLAPDRGDMQARWLGPAALPVSALAALAVIAVITAFLMDGVDESENEFDMTATDANAAPHETNSETR